MMKDGHAVVILLIDTLLVLCNQGLKTLIELILSCKHHRSQSLTILNCELLFVIDEIKHGLNHVFVLVSNG